MACLPRLGPAELALRGEACPGIGRGTPATWAPRALSTASAPGGPASAKRLFAAPGPRWWQIVLLPRLRAQRPLLMGRPGLQLGTPLWGPTLGAPPARGRGMGRRIKATTPGPRRQRPAPPVSSCYAPGTCRLRPAKLSRASRLCSSPAAGDASERGLMLRFGSRRRRHPRAAAGALPRAASSYARSATLLPATTPSRAAFCSGLAPAGCDVFMDSLLLALGSSWPRPATPTWALEPAAATLTGAHGGLLCEVSRRRSPRAAAWQ